MLQICPKCGIKGKFGYFGTPDEKGIVGMFTHKTGKHKIVKDILGNKSLVAVTERHFVTLEELEETSWFNGWKKEYWKEVEMENK